MTGSEVTLLFFNILTYSFPLLLSVEVELSIRRRLSSGLLLSLNTLVRSSLAISYETYLMDAFL